VNAAGVLPSAFAATLLLEQVAGAGPPRYRATRTLVFNPGAGADGVRVVPGSGDLRGAFQERVVTLPRGTGAAAAQVTSGAGGGLVVALAARRLIHQITLASGQVAGVTHLTVHRMDGAVPADTPTRTAAVGAGSVVTVGGDFADLRFFLRRVPPPPPNLPVAALVDVRVKGFPTGPRVGLANPATPDQAEFFWREAGEHPAPVPVDFGSALEEALQTHLDGRMAAGASPSHPLEVLLVWESEAPAAFHLSHPLAVGYQAVAKPLPGGEEKLVLRFPGTAGFSQRFTLALPPSGTVAAGQLTTTPSFRGRPAVLAGEEAGGEGGGAGSGALPVLPQRGALLEPGRWVGQRIPLTGAVAVEGILLAGWALEPDTRIRIEVREDRDGTPAGPPLAEAVVDAGPLRRAIWARALPRGGAALLPPGAWILATAAHGSLVWLAEEGLPSAVAYPAGEKGGPVLASGRSMESIRCIVQLSSPRSGKETAGPAPNGDAPASEALPFSLSIGGVPLTRLASVPGEAQGRVGFDLLPALAQALPPGGGGSGAPREVEVEVAALSPGILAIYPPEVHLQG